MSIKRDDTEAPESLNIENLAAFGTVDSTAGNGNAVGDGESAYVTESIDLPDNHIIAVHGFRTTLSDMNEIIAGNPVQVWWFNEDYQPDGSFTADTPRADAYHEYAVHSGGADNSPTAALYPEGLSTDFTDKWGYPLLNYTGDFTVRWEYLGGAHGEIGFDVMYEFVEVDEDHLVKELSQRI